MSKIRKICHLSDIHIRKIPTRHSEYRDVFNELYKSLEEQKPDRIVIVGDLLNDYLDLQTEQLILVSEFLNRISEIAPVRITRGNHEIRKASLDRKDCIEAIIKSINNPNIINYNETKPYMDENVLWMVWKHGDRKKNNPWKSKEYKQLNNIDHLTTIDLFHDPINGSLSENNYEFNSKVYYKKSDLKSNFSFLGDIHKHQYLNKEKTKAYAGSLIAQKFSEGDDNFHGYLLWDIENKTVENISIHNNYSYKNIVINPYTDFDDLDIDIDNPTSDMRLRFIWQTLPEVNNIENKRKLTDYFKNKYNIIRIANKLEYIEEEKIEVQDDDVLENINDPVVQHRIFKNYFEKIGVEEEIIDEILKLDDEITSRIEIEDFTNIEWSIARFWGKNFMSYKDIDIDWYNKDGVYQITGENVAGKTTIMKLLTYILYGKTLETEEKIKYGDSRYVNNKLNVNYCDGGLILEANGEYYGIEKRTEITRNKNKEINGASTKIKYYKLESINSDINDNNNIDNLNEEERRITQNRIDKIIGTYDNFMRIVMTTSDTLNLILSNNKADFIDSLLYDGGLDIFDVKLEAFKIYNKEVLSKNRITCNIDQTNNKIKQIIEENEIYEKDVNNIINNLIPTVKDKIQKGEDYVEDLRVKLYNIDNEIYNLNVDDVGQKIKTHKRNIVDLTELKETYEIDMSKLKETYDEKKLIECENIKENHKGIINDLKIKIKDIERLILDETHKIQMINGDVVRLKNDGKKKKDEINELINSKICPKCGQPVLPEHQKHITIEIEKLKNEAIEIGRIIKNKENNETSIHEENIVKHKNNIIGYQDDINKKTIDMDDILKIIGELTNDKNDVQKRKEMLLEYNNIPIKIDNENLNINILNDKLIQFDKNKQHIEENKKINKLIELAKAKLLLINNELDELKNIKIIKNSNVIQNEGKIVELEKLIIDFKKQERYDGIMNLYKKCVHRDGIPTQLLRSKLIPIINETLAKILVELPFNVWLDSSDLKLKLAYNSFPDAIINARSSSGKERTFSSIPLKLALNKINAKSKPKIFLLDEVMTKLKGESVDEFVSILHVIKTYIDKVLVIEHEHEINPDYLLSVEKDLKHISKVELE